MPRHAGLPSPDATILSKADLLATLKRVDESPEARKRVLNMETTFRTRIDSHIGSLPATDAQFSKFYTSPYVLLMFALRGGYSRISQLEADILPAKLFSSMETSAGRMIEEITFPIYGWQSVASEMHTPNSALDGRRIAEGIADVVTLKSGPRTLNDEMAENLADAILANASAWAADAGTSSVAFAYGTLYGTLKQSNKKDWHILRTLHDKTRARGGSIVRSPNGRWDCVVSLHGVEVVATVRVGLNWWDYLGGPSCAMEVWTALIRACVLVGDADPIDQPYVISDLAAIVSTEGVPSTYNVALLQRTQLPWLFFVARHFCDTLVP